VNLGSNLFSNFLPKKDIEYLSDEQKQFIFSCDIFKNLNKEQLRDLKITLIQNNGSR
jgi:hypothetical protein